MATIKDTDLLYVQRGETPHNWTGAELKELITSTPGEGTLIVGNYLTPFNGTFDGTGNLTINVDGTSAATANKVVVRDNSGNFAGNVITAASFVGDGQNLTNTGATLSVAGGSQRLVMTNLTSGTMTAAATDADLYFNASTDTLHCTNFSANGIASFASGNVNIDISGNVSIIGTGTVANPRISLNSTGSAEFAGKIVIGGDGWADDNEIGVTLRPEGQIAARRVSGSTEGVFTGYAIGNSSPTSAIFSDGSAEFKSSVLSRDTDTADFFTYMNIGGLYGNSNATTETFRINSSDGSFSGSRFLADRSSSSGTCFAALNNGTLNAYINADGAIYSDSYIQVENGSTNNGRIGLSGSIDRAIQVYPDKGNTSNRSVEIYWDGRAAFASGNFTVNQFGYFNASNNYYADSTRFAATPDFTNDNSVNLYLNGTANSIVGGDTVWTLNNDGSAVFNGKLTVNRPTDGNVASFGAKDAINYYFQSDSSGPGVTPGTVGLSLGTDIKNLPGDANIFLGLDGTAHFRGNVSSDGTIGFNLEPDNPANYTTTTDAEGNETSVYNGPTLDIKARILNLISRMDAIEANEQIDDATDTSLLQLVANASSRLDAIEARLTALEGGN